MAAAAKQTTKGAKAPIQVNMPRSKKSEVEKLHDKQKKGGIVTAGDMRDAEQVDAANREAAKAPAKMVAKEPGKGEAVGAATPATAPAKAPAAKAPAPAAKRVPAAAATAAIQKSATAAAAKAPAAAPAKKNTMTKADIEKLAAQAKKAGEDYDAALNAMEEAAEKWLRLEITLDIARQAAEEQE